MDTTIEKLDIQASFNGNDALAKLSNLQKILDKIESSAKRVNKETENSDKSVSKSNFNWSKLQNTLTGYARALSKCFDATNSYVESLNLFKVSMGSGIDNAKEFAETVEQSMGINSKSWMEYQGSFNQLLEGYGIAETKANEMSKQLTQLTYDLSSLRNVSADTAFQKMQSGMSGQIKGLKEWGINLSIATLRETALANGISLSTAKMTESQKAVLRYITLMNRTSEAQGDLARTLQTPENALRILKNQFEIFQRTTGKVVSVIAVKMIPVVQVLIQYITELAQKLATALGYELPDIEYDGLQSASSYADDLSDSLDKSTESAKKLKASILGIDEINALSDPNSGEGSTTGYGGGLANDFGFDPTKGGYNFLENVDTGKLDEIREKMNKVIDAAVAVGGAIAAWKLSKSLINGIEFLRKIKPQDFNWKFSIVGMSLFLDDLNKFRKAVKDISENGFHIDNTTEAISGFVGMVSDISLMAGQVKLAGILDIVKGIADIVGGIAEIKTDGANVDNVTRVIRGVNSIVMGAALLSGNTKLAGITIAIQGVTSIVSELSEHWQEIKKGDFSGLDKQTLIVGAINVFIGIAVALGKFKKITDKLSGLKGKSKTSTAIEEITNSTDTVSKSMSGLTSKLKTLIKDLALGLVVIVEVAVAAGLIVGAIWGLGLMLEQVGIAWQPVINNYKTILIALGVGIGALVAIGAITAGLGALTTASGYTLPIAIGIGTALLLELGVATGLFIAEVWAIGKGLDKVGKAWQPVLEKKDTISQGIKTGTKYLLAVGGATAALGIVTLATGLTLPAAIAVGTAMLKDIGDSVVEFNNSLSKVAGSLNNDLHPALAALNTNLPILSVNMNNFIGFMKTFAGQAVSYSKDSAVAGLASTVDKIVKFFTKDPIETMAGNVNKNRNQTAALNSELVLANPELKLAINLISTYNGFLGKLEKLTDTTSSISLSSGMFTNMKEVGKNLVRGFVSGMKSESSSLSNATNSILNSTFSVGTARSYGYSFGQGLGKGLSDGFKSSKFPTLKGTVSVINNQATLALNAYAAGGFPEKGEMFIAREAGPEMVGRIGKKTSVANNEQIVTGISQGVSDANSEQNALLREQNNLLRQLLSKETNVKAYVTTSDITNGLQRAERRNGVKV